MISKLRFLSSAAVLAAALFSAAPAFADSISLTFTNPDQTATAGSVVSFYGSVFAPATNNGTVSLDSDTLTGPSFAALAGGYDDSGFQGSFISIDPGETLTGLLFTVTVPNNIGPDVYSATYEIDGTDSNGSSLYTNRPIQITIAPNIAATPEPGTWLLLITGMGAVACSMVYAKRSASELL